MKALIFVFITALSAIWIYFIECEQRKYNLIISIANADKQRLRQQIFIALYSIPPRRKLCGKRNKLAK